MAKKSKKDRDQLYWDKWWLGLAQYISTASKDPSTKVGAVIVDEDNRLVSTGYNGLPRGTKDSPERLNNRDLKKQLVLHAETNAILFAERSLKNCTIYVHPFMPCSCCAGSVIQKGIKRVVAPFSDNPRWLDSFKLSQELFDEAGIELVLM